MLCYPRLRRAGSIGRWHPWALASCKCSARRSSDPYTPSDKTTTEMTELRGWERRTSLHAPWTAEPTGCPTLGMNSNKYGTAVAGANSPCFLKGPTLLQFPVCFCGAPSINFHHGWVDTCRACRINANTMQRAEQTALTHGASPVQYRCAWA